MRVRLEVARIAQDGNIRRRVLDTTDRADVGRWESLVNGAPAFPPPYWAAPGDTIYQVSMGEKTFMVSEEDLTGSLQDLVQAVLAEGDEL
jgi:hypothetical protein